ncbi:MAG: quinone oxidoreductase [Dehalococcoidia bacterium]|nr:quinone oxidoreductase [Dehalococcoidia bacterium]
MKAIRMHEQGPPDVLKYEDCPDPSPGTGEVVVDIEASGVNFLDLNIRSGAYPAPEMPSVPGREAAGRVSAVGEGVEDVKVGDVVAYCGVVGAYAQKAAVPTSALIKMPEGLDATMGAAVLLQGMTAHYLAYGTYPLKQGDSCLVHAGAGGTGALLVQMAKRAGARVFTTVSTDEKAAIAREAGADHVIIYTRDDFEEAVKEVTGGAGLQVVYDSVGKTTFEKSMKCLGPRGYMVLFGQASGPVPPMEPARLGAGSLFLTRPSLTDYTETREDLVQRATDVLDWTRSGELKVRIGATFPLAEAAEAHHHMESRRSTGKLVLVP